MSTKQGQTPKKEIKALKQVIAELARSEKITYIGLFGSTARGEENESSDLDLIVNFQTTPSLFRLLDFEEKLQQQLGKKIDLITHDSISPYLQHTINRDLITLYERT